MALKLKKILAVLLLILSVSIVVTQSSFFDVTSSKYGGKRHSDISKALSMAWTDACASTSTSTILVPKGTYKLHQAKLEGPCKAPIQFQLQGALQAPKDRSQLDDDTWVRFVDINRLTLSGGGIFDGRGEFSWIDKRHHDSTPVDIKFEKVNNSIVSNIASIDSAKFHIKVESCNNVTLQKMTITAPKDSPNTDGVHIARSTRITFTDSIIATGDDCASIGDGAKQILVSNITCGPGHGISIGSLGKYKDEEPVVGVTVRNCTLTNTTNGARIKTWPDSPGKSVAWDILFQDIVMVNVKNPILIDQNYCDKGKSCKLQVPSRVQLGDVRFKNIKGASSSPVAVRLDCSKAAPCRSVELSDIDLIYVGDKDEEAITSECSNVKPRMTRVMKALACANLGDTPIDNSPKDHHPSPSSPPPLYVTPPSRQPLDVSPPPPKAEMTAPMVYSPPPPPHPSDDSHPPIIIVYGGGDGSNGLAKSAAANSRNILGLKPTATVMVLISRLALLLLHGLV